MKRANIWLRDFFQRAWAEFFEISSRYLLWRSYGHLVQIALHRDLAQQLQQKTCQGDLAHDLPQRSSQRELAEPHLVTSCYSAVRSLGLLHDLHVRHATLLYVLLDLHKYVMLRCCAFSWTSTYTSCCAADWLKNPIPRQLRAHKGCRHDF